MKDTSSPSNREEIQNTYEEEYVGGFTEIKRGLNAVREQRERYKEEKELEKEGKKIPGNSRNEIKERGIREKSNNSGEIERTTTSHQPIEGTPSLTKNETYIFGKKYVKGEKSSRIRLVLLCLLLAAVVAFFLIILLIPK